MATAMKHSHRSSTSMSIDGMTGMKYGKTGYGGLSSSKESVCVCDPPSG